MDRMGARQKYPLLERPKISALECIPSKARGISGDGGRKISTAQSNDVNQSCGCMLELYLNSLAYEKGGHIKNQSRTG